uniref:Kinetochore protein NDC80 n=1 Tax=Blastobotrys adeninivorans TaxID=409370 RepID=A0A060T258_BLAAD
MSDPFYTGPSRRPNRISDMNTPGSIRKQQPFRPSGGPRASMLPVSRSSMVPPAPSSTIRNSRSSLAPSSIRRSMAPGGMGAGAGGLLGSARKPRQSSFGVGMFQSMVNTVATRDPRPLKDRSFQAKMAEELLEYLSNYCDLGSYQVTLHDKMVRSPTQKEFAAMFKCLYHRLDPGYDFSQRAIEHDVYFLLKTIGYPYMESITKSQISAVGGTNHWPTFLGVLHWMAQLNLSIDEYEQQEDELHLRDREASNVIDSIYARYFLRAYPLYLDNTTDPSLDDELRQECDKFTANLEKDIDGLEKENRELARQLQHLNKVAEDLEAVKVRHQTLESDVVKFQAYIDNMKSRKERWTTVIEKLKEEEKNCQQELEQLQQETANLENHIKSQGLSTTDIDSMNSERDNLRKSIQTVEARMDEVREHLDDRERVAVRAQSELDRILKEYNSSLDDAGVESESRSDLLIRVNDPLSSENVGKLAYELLDGQDIPGSIRPRLLDNRQKLSMKIHDTQDKMIQLQEKAEQLAEDINERRDQKENLEANLNASRIQHDEIADNMNNDATKTKAAIEGLERKIGSMQAAVHSGSLELEQQEFDVGVERDRLRHDIEYKRGEMYDEVSRLVTLAVDFKLGIQTALEEYENFTNDGLRSN